MLPTASPRLARRHVLRGLAAGLAGSVGLAVLAACGDASGDAGGDNSLLAAERLRRTVTIDDDDVRPMDLTVSRGTTITWHNTSSRPRRITTDPSEGGRKGDPVVPPGVAPWRSGVVEPGQKWTHTFDDSGYYVYYCTAPGTADLIGMLTVAP